MEKVNAKTGCGNLYSPMFRNALEMHMLADSNNVDNREIHSV